MKKRNTLSILLLLFLSTFAFSLDGQFSGEKNLRVIKTQWFDIIFSESSEITANKIAKVADSYYEEITTRLGTDMYQRFPVSITSAVESSNAYFSVAPYNLIVLFDTAICESLDMNEESIETTFYHELTHAVTLNMKSPFWRGMAHFSDIFNPAGISLTTFWYEGATVSMESRNTLGGRLNDPFSTQLVSIAKIKSLTGEKKFPSWRDVTGARDTIPGGTDAYIFGASFAKYLQETYGMEKYSEFWKNAGTSFSLSFCAGIFKKTYKTKLSDEWKKFYDWIPVLHEDFQKINFNKKDKNRYVKTFDIFHSDNSDSDKKIAFYDSQSTAIWISQNDKKFSKLISISGIQKLQFSKDGKKLAITRLIDKSNVKSEVGIINIEEKSYSRIKKSDSTNAYFSIDDNLQFTKISEEKNRNEFSFSPIQIDKNIFAKILKTGLNWKIRLIQDNENYDFDFEHKIIHNLHLSQNNDEKFVLTFTFAELGKGFQMLSRIGFIEIEKSSKNAKLYLQKSDYKTGILEADILSKNNETLEFFTIVENYASNPIHTFSLNISDFDESELNSNIYLIENIKENEIVKNEGNNFEYKKYNPLNYYKNGAKFPFGMVPFYNSDFEMEEIALLGATFLSANPWTDKIINFSGAYDIADKKGGVLLSLSGGNDAYSYSISGTSIFNAKGFQQTFDSFSFSWILCKFLVSSISFEANSNLFYGKESDINFDDEIDELEKNEIAKYVISDGLHSQSFAGLKFSNVHKVASGYQQYLGFYLNPFINYEYKNLTCENTFIKKFDDNSTLLETIETKDKSKYVNVGGTFGIKFPGFFPITLQSTIFPKEDVFASANASVILFSAEIQKGIPALSIFANRFILKTSYSCELAYESNELFDVKRINEITKDIDKDSYSDSVSLSALVTLAPNTGYFTSNNFIVGCSGIFRPNPKENKKKWGIGLYFDVNF